MRLNYPDILPITSHKDEIVKAIEENQVVIVVGETGSGKSTQIPKMIMEALANQLKTDPTWSNLKIACTQPRRIAAVSISSWIAHEMGVELGKEVGYKIRFDDDTTAGTIINICTDGIILQEMKGDGLLSRYNAILVDEAHERNLNIDFLLGLLKDIQVKRDQAGMDRLKILVTSATFDAGKFAVFFEELNADKNGKARPIPVINVSGRMYPVDIVYELPAADEDVYRKIAQRVKGIIKGPDSGDVLIFMPGEAEIFKTIRELEMVCQSAVKCLPLYSRLSMDVQEQIYNDFPGQVKVVVATNIAETSLTVPGIKYVIDSGVARMTDFNFRTGIGSLEIQSISQASAIQRAGRAGRVQAGTCIRLYEEEDFLAREKYTKPEIQRSDLSSVVLHMRLIGITNLTAFSFLDAPEPKAFRNAIANLIELGALDEEQNLTPLGVKMAHLPLEPRISAMLMAAEKFNCVREVAIIASSLSVKDPFLRPNGEEEEADRAKRYFQKLVIGAGAKYRIMRIRKGRRVITKRVKDRNSQSKELASDLIVFLIVWNKLQKIEGEVEREYFCQSNYLNYLMLQEIGKIYRQLLDTLNIFAKDEFSKYLLNENQTDLSVDLENKEGILKAISSGFIQNLCEATSPQTYRTRNAENVMIHPGSALFNVRPRFFVSAEVVETTRLYARNNTAIEPSWLEEIAPQLCRVKRGPTWFDKQNGRSVWEEEVFFRGLRIVKDRLVDLAKTDPKQAQDAFIREGLVKRNLLFHYPWLKDNQQLISKLKTYAARLDEAKWVLTEAKQRDWYQQKIEEAMHAGGKGGYVTSMAELDLLLKQKGGDYLKMHESEIISPAEKIKLERLFPDSVYLAGKQYDVNYNYDESFVGKALIVLGVEDLLQLSSSIVQANLKDFPELKAYFVVKAGAVGQGIGERDWAGESSEITEGEDIDIIKQEVDLWHIKKKWKKVRRDHETKGVQFDSIWHYLPTLLEKIEVGDSLFKEGAEAVIYAYTGLRMEGKKIVRTIFAEESLAKSFTVEVLRRLFEKMARNGMAFTESQIKSVEKGNEQFFYNIEVLDVLGKALWKSLDFEGHLDGVDKIQDVVFVKAFFDQSKSSLDSKKEKIIKLLQKHLRKMHKLAGSERSEDLLELAEMKKNLEQGLFD